MTCIPSIMRPLAWVAILLLPLQPCCCWAASAEAAEVAPAAQAKDGCCRSQDSKPQAPQHDQPDHDCDCHDHMTPKVATIVKPVVLSGHDQLQPTAFVSFDAPIEYRVFPAEPSDVSAHGPPPLLPRSLHAQACLLLI